jgi:hypothetical protein
LNYWLFGGEDTWVVNLMDIESLQSMHQVSGLRKKVTHVLCTKSEERDAYTVDFLQKQKRGMLRDW